MKKIIAICLFIIANFSFSQSRTVNGVIKDSNTLLPVESVSIGLSNSNVGTISNEEGKFKITLSGNENTLNFSHLYYKLENYSVKQTDTEIEIFLQPKSFVLDEVVVNQKPGKTVLEEAVVASKSKLEKSLILTTYYREFINVEPVGCNYLKKKN